MLSCYLHLSLHLDPVLHTQSGPRQRSRYNDWLRAGRSGDRIPVLVKFTAPVHTGPGVHPPSYTTGTGSFPALNRPGRGFDHTPPLAPRLKKV